MLRSFVKSSSSVTSRAALLVGQRALLARVHIRYCSDVASEQAGVPFRELVETFAAIENVKQSRDTSVLLLAAQFHDVLRRSPSASTELASALFLTAAQLAPPHDGVELRFGTRSFAPVIEQLLTPATDTCATNDSSNSSGTHRAALDVSKFSDLGTAVQSLITSGDIVLPAADDSSLPIDRDDTNTYLTIASVHNELMRLACEEGSGAVRRKQQRAIQLLQQCRSANEMVYLVRLLAHQSLRIGMGEKSILAALAIASTSSSTSSLSLQASNAPDAVEVKTWIDTVTRAFAQQPDYAALARLVVASQAEQTLVERTHWLDARAAPTVGVPVLTMSAYPVASVAAVLARTRKTLHRTATCEYKYDGARVQIHLALRVGDDKDNKPVVARIFSRNMEDNTDKYRSLLDVLTQQLTPATTSSSTSGAQPQALREVILEGEVVAIDRATQSFLPFQVLQTKTTTSFCLFVFDLLHLDSERQVLHRPLRERRTLLRSIVTEAPGYLEFVKSVDMELPCATSDANTSDDSAKNEHDAVRSVLEDAVAAGCEGLMVKMLDGPSADYKAGMRSYAWMKVKQDYLVEEETDNGAKGDAAKTTVATTKTNHGTFLPDTLDLVPVGAFYGKGRRAGVFGSFLLAAYNATTDKFETIGKVGSGFTDAQLVAISQRLEQQLRGTTAVDSRVVSGATRSREPDVWLSPSEVWEIKATQLTASPLYTCAAELDDDDNVGDDDDTTLTTLSAPVRKRRTQRKGLALRFPRFVRLRDDKNVEQATERTQLRELFNDQTVTSPRSSSNNSGSSSSDTATNEKA